MCDNCTRRSMLLLVAACAAAKGRMPTMDDEARLAHLGEFFTRALPPDDPEHTLSREEKVAQVKGCVASAHEYAKELSTDDLVHTGQDCDELEDVFGAVLRTITSNVRERADAGDARAQSALGSRLPPELAALLAGLAGDDAPEGIAILIDHRRPSMKGPEHPH